MTRKRHSSCPPCVRGAVRRCWRQTRKSPCRGIVSSGLPLAFSNIRDNVTLGPRCGKQADGTTVAGDDCSAMDSFGLPAVPVLCGPRGLARPAASRAAGGACLNQASVRVSGTAPSSDKRLSGGKGLAKTGNCCPRLAASAMKSAAAMLPDMRTTLHDGSTWAR